MDFLRDLAARLPWLDALPSALREPPGLYALLAAVALAVVLVIALLARLVFGPRRPEEHRTDIEVRRSLKRDLAEMKRQGNHRGVGEHYEGLGQSQKALDAYKRGDCHEERASLLIELGRRREAKKVAREHGVWRLYAELCQEDGELEEAAVAFERDGQAYLAARCYESAEQNLAAARCYVAAGMEAQAVGLLGDVEGREAAELLDRALRASIVATGAQGLSLELQQAVRRTVQMWLAAGEARRAFELAVAAEQWSLAVPVARDYLEPSAEAAELCERADAPLVAAEIWQRLGEDRRAALQRAVHHQRRDEAAEAARCFEQAEAWSDAADQWALAGDTERAAQLFKQSGDLQSAAQLYAQSGDTERSQQLLSQAHALSVEGRFESDATSRLGGEHTVAAGSPSSPLPARGARHTVPAGDSAERYRLVEELGRGGMGVVYRAEDRMLQREVAYKAVPESAFTADSAPDGLLAEARAAARLSHPNIVQVYDAGRRGEGFFIVMELVRGETLEAMLERRRMTLRGVIQVGRQVCAALEHAHARRIIHRDLKPSNLLWSEDRRIKLSDFGLARAFEAGVGNVRTQAAGTPSYMSPEQIRGEPLSPQADLYAFGCVLWEMLCRQPVFGTGGASFHHHLTSPPKDPRTEREDVPAPLAELILQCLEKDPERRPRSAKEISTRLAEILESDPVSKER